MLSDELHQKFRSIRDNRGLDDNHRTRLHRAISWLKCAEKYSDSNDDDIAVIALWISFNSCYSVDAQRHRDLSERKKFHQLTINLVRFDIDKRLYDLIWKKYPKEVKALVGNKFIFAPYWASLKEPDLNWQDPFTKSRRLALSALKKGDTAILLSILLDRLYVLRNQLFHGAATYKGGVNRDQVRDAKGFLFELMPIIIEIMFNKANWGEIYFPVIDQ